MGRRLLVIGLDCAPPRLLYEELIDELPTLSELLSGSRALLKSSHPPITIPAWLVMVTGKTPGELGMYGFRHRKPGSYNDYYIVNSRFVKHPTLWDEAGRRGLRSVVAGVPPSYPPRPVRGLLLTDFVTPGPEVTYTFPPGLKREIEERFGPYIFDVKFRSEDRERVRRELWEMTRQHFKVYSYLAQRAKWDFYMLVEIGVDRVQHAFWGYMDPEHHKYVPGNKYENVIRDYYKLIDRSVTELLKHVPKDAVIAIVSDHGAKRMKGAFVINQWLAEKGYLKLKEDKLPPGTELKDAPVDWSKTIAWGWGGYYARVFINLKGREPKGVVKKEDYEHYRDELAEEFRKIRGPNGEKWETKVYKPEELYPEVRGDPPDLIVYFDDLSWRSAGTLGWPTKYLKENDRGPDDAVHDWFGVLAVHDPEGSFSLSKQVVDIVEVHDLFASILWGE